MGSLGAGVGGVATSLFIPPTLGRPDTVRLPATACFLAAMLVLAARP